jgi:hypothetical protein
MKYSRILDFDRGVEILTVKVSANIRLNENRLFELSEFEADETLRPGELEVAKWELIERARSYPDSGENEQIIYNPFHPTVRPVIEMDSLTALARSTS